MKKNIILIIIVMLTSVNVNAQQGNGIIEARGAKLAWQGSKEKLSNDMIMTLFDSNYVAMYDRGHTQVNVSRFAGLSSVILFFSGSYYLWKAYYYNYSSIHFPYEKEIYEKNMTKFITFGIVSYVLSATTLATSIILNRKGYDKLNSVASEYNKGRGKITDNMLLEFNVGFSSIGLCLKL